MLRLLPNWFSVTAGSLALDLLDQVSGEARIEVARHLLAQTLSIAARGWRRRWGRLVRLHVMPHLSWRIEQLVCTYLPDVDSVVERYRPTTSEDQELILVVPPPSHDIVRRALGAAMGDRAPSVRPTDFFVTWHVTFAAQDLGWTRRRTVSELIKGYNRRALRCGSNAAILIGVPAGFAVRWPRRRPDTGQAGQYVQQVHRDCRAE